MQGVGLNVCGYLRETLISTYTACRPSHICARLQCSGPVHCIIALFDIPELSIVFLQTMVRLSSQSHALTHTFHHIV